MENQINVGIQRQSYEPFETVDSEAGNQNADASLAGDSAGANTSGNPDVANAQVDGESVNQTPPETVLTNNTLNRYGIGDTVILGRPEYAFNDRATIAETTFAANEIAEAAPFAMPAAIPTGFIPAPALQSDPAQICPNETEPASSGLETATTVNATAAEKAPADATRFEKDATTAPAPATQRGTKLPPRDGVIFTFAREYAAQHGFNTEETDQVAAIFAYYNCTTAQDCKETMECLPYHITSIMQGIGWNSEGVFHVGLALRNIQEAERTIAGDPNAANGNLYDLAGLGSPFLEGRSRIVRAGAGQGEQDYANEMSASQSVNTSYFDLGDDYSNESYDASHSYDAYDPANSTPQIDLDPLPSLPAVDSNGPMMLPPPDIRLDREWAPLPDIEIDEAETNPLTPEEEAQLPRTSVEIGEVRLAPPTDSTAATPSDPAKDPNFIGYNTDGQPLLRNPATERRDILIEETSHRLTGLSTAVDSSVLGFDAAGKPYSGVRNALGEISWYALGFAEANSIMNARANGAYAEVGGLSLARGAMSSAGMAVFAMAMPSNAGRDSTTINLDDGTRFVVGAGAFVGHLEARDANGNWAVVEYGVGLDRRTGTAFSTLTDDERRAAGLPPSLLPPNPDRGLLTNPALTNDERNRINGTTPNLIQPNTLPPLEGFQTSTQSIDDLIIESSRAPNGSTRVNGYDYEFDANSRIDNVEGDLNREDGTRNRSHQSGAGGADRLPDDDGGHIVGNRFYPPGEEFNYIAENSNFNRGSYRQLENEWAQLLADGHTVHVRWDFEYSGDSQRPDGFVVRYRVDGGDEYFAEFQNRRGGK